jgi:hypothetical protein
MPVKDPHTRIKPFNFGQRPGAGVLRLKAFVQHGYSIHTGIIITVVK